MTHKNKNTKTHKFEKAFIKAEAEKIFKDFAADPKNRKYFGIFDKKTFSVILLTILVLVVVGDFMLLHHFYLR